MKKTILFFLSLIFLSSCNNSKKENTREFMWYEGGNLHESIVLDWKSADEKNKLATCADFASKIKLNKGEGYSSDLEMKSDAVYLKNCIDEAVKEESVNNYKVTEIAALCLLLKNTN